MAKVQIFLSAVSAEFGGYRDALRRYLDSPNRTVKVQDDFIATGTETLDKLDVYIRQCNTVIHLVGDMTGAMAGQPSVAMLRQRYPDFCDRFPVLEPFLDLTKDSFLPYTQWEAWLALYHRKRLLIATPKDGATRDERYHFDQAQSADQQAHLKRLASVERYPEIHFSNADQLGIEVFRSKSHDILGLHGTHSAEFLERLALHSRQISDRLAADIPEPVNFETVICADGRSLCRPVSDIQGGGAKDAVALSGSLAYLERTLKSIRDDSKTTVLEIFDRWMKMDGPGSSGPVVVIGAGAQGKTTELCRLVRHIRDIVPDPQGEIMPICYLDLPRGFVRLGDGGASFLTVDDMVRQTLRLPSKLEPETLRAMLRDLPPAIFLVDIAQALATTEGLYALFGALCEFYYDNAQRHLLLVTYRTTGVDPVVDKLEISTDSKWRRCHPYKIQPVEAAQIERVMSPLACFQNLPEKERSDYIELLSTDLLMLEHCRQTTDEAALRSRAACFYDATRKWQVTCTELGISPSTVLNLADIVCRTDGDLSIDADDESICQSLECDPEESESLLEKLAGANIIRRRFGDDRYEFIHSDYAYFYAALWIRCQNWVTLRSKEDYQARRSEAVKRVMTTSHTIEFMRFLPGVLERLERDAQSAKDGESDLYGWLRARFVKWPEPNIDLTSVRLNILQIAETYLDIHLTGENQLVGLCEDALSLQDSETRYRVIEQLLNFFFRQAMARRGAIKELGAAKVVNALTRTVAADLRAGKNWSQFPRLAIPWVLQRYGPQFIQPLVRRFYPESVAKMDSTLFLLLVLAGQAFSTRAPIDAGEKEIEKVRKTRQEVVSFVLEQCHSLLESIGSYSGRAKRRESPMVKLVALMIFTTYRFNERPCNFYQIMRALFGDAAGTERDSSGRRTWLVRIADLIAGSSDALLQEKDWLIELCDSSQNGLVTWYTYTILSIHGNRLETSTAVIDILDDLAMDKQPNGVRRYVAFHALRSLIFYSDVIRADKSLFKKATDAFERVARGALLEPTIEPSASRTLTFGVVGSGWMGMLKRRGMSLILGRVPPYDNEFLLYYAQFLFLTEVSDIKVAAKLTELSVDYLNRCRGKEQIQEFKYVVDTIARVGIAETYTGTALKVLNSLQEKFSTLQHNTKAVQAMQQAIDKVGEYQPREAKRQRLESKWDVKEGRKIRDRAVAAEIYEPQSFYGDAVYQNVLFNEIAQKSFADATKEAACAKSMFKFFFAYTNSVAISISHGKMPQSP